MREYRNFSHEIKSERAEGESIAKIVGYAAVFRQKTDLGFFTESIAPGAFKASLDRGDDVRALIDHDPSKIIGRSPKTLMLTEDDTGLKYEVTPPDTVLARDLVTNISAGLITQSSFGFYIEREEVDQSGDKPHFTILEARLFDVSPVTFPAYEGTSVSLARSQVDNAESLVVRLKKFSISSGEAEKFLRDRRAKHIALSIDTY
jgi:uncharacterized protein